MVARELLRCFLDARELQLLRCFGLLIWRYYVVAMYGVLCNL